MRRLVSLPVQLCVVGAAAGGGLACLILANTVAAVLLFCVAGLLVYRIWQSFGWQAWYMEDIIHAIATLPTSIAVYDEKDRLITCNKHYIDLGPSDYVTKLISNRRLRTRYSDIVRLGLDPDLTEQQRAEAIREWHTSQPTADGKLVEKRFPHMGWLRIGKRTLPGGGNVRVAIEINELKQREAELIKAIEHGRRADDMKSKFFSKMTHELRTPLNGIIGMANIVLLADLDPKTARNVEVLRSSGVHLLDLVNRVLDFSKLNEHVDAQKAMDFDLFELVREVLNEAQFSPHAEGLSLKSDHAPGLSRHWHGNRTGLRQVLTNLIGNAIKFTDKGGVVVRLNEDDDGLNIEVIDSGIGIPEDDLDKIFNAFQQADGNWAQHYGGTGLGLTICVEIIEAMGGSIRVASTQGQGSRFGLQIPLLPLKDDDQLPLAS